MKNIRDYARSMFYEHTANHTVSILHDDGLYRHLMCSNQGSSLYRFDIVTYPGYLVVSGDMGEWIFSTQSDVLNFFRRDGGEINPYYWAQKCRAGETMEFCEETFADYVERYVLDFFNDDPEVSGDVMSAVREDVLFYDNEADCRAALIDFEYRVDKNMVFTFVDASEAASREYTFHFLWALHGIVWAINEYDKLDGGLK